MGLRQIADSYFLTDLTVFSPGKNTKRNACGNEGMPIRFICLWMWFRFRIGSVAPVCDGCEVQTWISSYLYWWKTKNIKPDHATFIYIYICFKYVYITYLWFYYHLYTFIHLYKHIINLVFPTLPCWDHLRSPHRSTAAVSVAGDLKHPTVEVSRTGRSQRDPFHS